MSEFKFMELMIEARTMNSRGCSGMSSLATDLIQLSFRSSFCTDLFLWVEMLKRPGQRRQRAPSPFQLSCQNAALCPSSMVIFMDAPKRGISEALHRSWEPTHMQSEPFHCNQSQRCLPLQSYQGPQCQSPPNTFGRHIVFQFTSGRPPPAVSLSSTALDESPRDLVGLGHGPLR